MEPKILISVVIPIMLLMVFVGLRLKKRSWSIRFLHYLLLYIVASQVQAFIGLLEGLVVLMLGWLIILFTSRAR